MNVRSTHPIGAPGYRLIRWIGASGAAAVYAAAERSSGRLVAVKIFHWVDVEGLARLEQLLWANARLAHPNIVGIREIGRTLDGRLFHSMPLLRGFERAHRDLIGRPRKIAALLRELLDGLDHAHRCGMVHGGIKPSNVLFDERGHVRLADFGIARCMIQLGRLRSDGAGYLSPEQAHGDPPGPRSDVYSIGMLAYGLLTGAPPIQNRNTIAYTATHVERPVPRRPPVTGAWQAWLDRALASPPEQRFQSTQEMADALRGIDGRRARGHAVGIARRTLAPKRALPAAVLVIAIVALAGWAAWGHRRAPATEAAVAPAATNAESPALPTSVATQPAPALPAVADSVSPLAEQVQGLVAAGDTLRARGQLFSPPFRNAASHYLAALAFDPGNPSATAGIDAMLATQGSRLDKAWNDARSTAEAAGMLTQGDELASHASASARRAWHSRRSRLARRVDDAVVHAARARDPLKIAALAPLARALQVKIPAAFDLAATQHVASTPKAGEPMRDRGGPLLVYVPAGADAPAFAFARVEVTLGDYAKFARATHRPAAKCLEAHNPFSRLRHLTWQTPGFVQGADQPVVCVSWGDAVAYAEWLSKTTGETYRLPSGDEWLRAARGMPKDTPCRLGNVDDASRQSRLDNDRWSCNDGAAQTAPVGHYAASATGAYDMYGNVSEWLAGGSPGLRLFRGLSWRDGSHETPFGRPGTADSDIGYTSVGFRVVRLIDPAHPAPAPPAIGDLASGHR